jgi:hypothetical protein
MLNGPWSAIEMQQSPPDLAVPGSMLHGDLTDIDAGLVHGDSTRRPDWRVQAAAAGREVLA